MEITNNIQKYKHYKPSGVQWLGDIPEHWEALPNKRFHRVKKSLNSNRDCDNVLSLTLRGVVNNNPDSPEGMVPKDYATYQVFDKNNLVFKLIDLENVRTSRVGIVHEKGIMSSAYIRLVVGEDSFPRFAYYYFFSLYINEVYNNLGSGVRSTLGPNDLLNIPFIKPPLQEQTAIAQFLDAKTTKIDEAITIKEQQISLLKERKQILIHKAVTRGLDDSVTLKDSGVEWIGEIPEHWEVKRLKEICKAFGRIGFRGYTTSDLVNEGEGAITISPSNIKEEFMTFEKCSYLSWKKYEESPEIQIFNNDVLIVKTGSTFGKIGIVKDLPQKATINPQLLVLKEININSDYFYSVLKTSMIQIQVQQEVIGSTIPTISETKILNFKMALPPKNEVEEVVLYLDDIREKFKTAIDLKQQEIEKLKEYKSSLINSVVTGKVKVC